MLQGLWLVHPEEAMCDAFRQRFVGLPGVRVIRGRFEDLEPHDCFVTAGNAFGLMTAGIDAAVSRRFGEELMQRVQHRIRIEVAAFPAMGTGFGQVPFGEAARQMAVAYRHFLKPPHRLDWDFVVERQRAICYDAGRQVVQ